MEVNELQMSLLFWSISNKAHTHTVLWIIYSMRVSLGDPVGVVMAVKVRYIHGLYI